MVASVPQLIEQHYNVIYEWCRKYFAGWDEVEDAAQLAALRMLKYQHTYDPAQPFLRWLRAHTRYACLAIVESRLGWLHITDEDAETVPMPEDAMHERRIPDLSDAPSWSLLNSEERMVARCIDNGMSHRETARYMGLNHGQITNKVRTMKNKLRSRLK